MTARFKKMTARLDLESRLLKNLQTPAKKKPSKNTKYTEKIFKISTKKPRKPVQKLCNLRGVFKKQWQRTIVISPKPKSTEKFTT
jgi:hypothetical protein